MGSWNNQNNWNYYSDVRQEAQDEDASEQYKETVASITRHIKTFERNLPKLRKYIPPCRR